MNKTATKRERGSALTEPATPQRLIVLLEEQSVPGSGLRALHSHSPASTMAGLLLGHTESTLSTRLVVHSSFS